MSVFVCSPVVLTSKHYMVRILFSLHFCTELKARICFCALSLDAMHWLNDFSIHQLVLDPAATCLVCMCFLLKSTTVANKNIINTHALQYVTTVFLSHHLMFDSLLWEIDILLRASCSYTAHLRGTSVFMELVLLTFFMSCQIRLKLLLFCLHRENKLLKKPEELPLTKKCLEWLL